MTLLCSVIVCGPESYFYYNYHNHVSIYILVYCCVISSTLFVIIIWKNPASYNIQMTNTKNDMLLNTIIFCFHFFVILLIQRRSISLIYFPPRKPRPHIVFFDVRCHPDLIFLAQQSGNCRFARVAAWLFVKCVPINK